MKHGWNDFLVSYKKKKKAIKATAAATQVQQDTTFLTPPPANNDNPAAGVSLTLQTTATATGAMSPAAAALPPAAVADLPNIALNSPEVNIGAVKQPPNLRPKRQKFNENKEADAIMVVKGVALVETDAVQPPPCPPLPPPPSGYEKHDKARQRSITPPRRECKNADCTNIGCYKDQRCGKHRINKESIEQKKSKDEKKRKVSGKISGNKPKAKQSTRSSSNGKQDTNKGKRKREKTEGDDGNKEEKA